MFLLYRKETIMPLFNEAHRIYHPDEINFLRSCYSKAAMNLENQGRDYCASELASCIMMLYESGLRNAAYVSEMAARLAYQRSKKRRLDGPYRAANSNISSSLDHDPRHPDNPSG